MENGEFTWNWPFWKQPLWRWDAMFAAGVRAHYVASVLAAPFMIAQRAGLIVNISFFAAQRDDRGVAYGVAKAASDRMAACMGHELRNFGIAAVSLYPGLVRTESVMQAAQYLDLSNSESPQFIGRAVAALAADPDIMHVRPNVCGGSARAGVRLYGYRWQATEAVDGRQSLTDIQADTRAVRWQMIEHLGAHAPENGSHVRINTRDRTVGHVGLSDRL